MDETQAFVLCVELVHLEEEIEGTVAALRVIAQEVMDQNTRPMRRHWLMAREYDLLRQLIRAKFRRDQLEQLLGSGGCA